MTRRPDYCSVYVQVSMVFIASVALLYIVALFLLRLPLLDLVWGRLLMDSNQEPWAIWLRLSCVRCLLPAGGAALISFLAYRTFLGRAKDRIQM